MSAPTLKNKIFQVTENANPILSPLQNSLQWQNRSVSVAWLPSAVLYILGKGRLCRRNHGSGQCLGKCDAVPLNASSECRISHDLLATDIVDHRAHTQATTLYRIAHHAVIYPWHFNSGHQMGKNKNKTKQKQKQTVRVEAKEAKVWKKQSWKPITSKENNVHDSTCLSCASTPCCW